MVARIDKPTREEMTRTISLIEQLFIPTLTNAINKKSVKQVVAWLKQERNEE